MTRGRRTPLALLAAACALVACVEPTAGDPPLAAATNLSWQLHDDIESGAGAIAQEELAEVEVCVNIRAM